MFGNIINGIHKTYVKLFLISKLNVLKLLYIHKSINNQFKIKIGKFTCINNYVLAPNININVSLVSINIILSVTALNMYIIYQRYIFLIIFSLTLKSDCSSKAFLWYELINLIKKIFSYDLLI